MARADRPVIIYRLGSLGDTVVALPCFHAIRRAFPDRRLLCLTNVPVSSKAAPLAAILRAGGFIDDVIDYPVGTRSPLALARLAWRLRATGADTLIHLAESRGLDALRRDLAFFRLAGLRHVLCAPTTRDLQEVRVDPVTGEEEPEAERLARTLAPLEQVDLTLRANWDLRLMAEERAEGASALAPLGGRPFLAINMGGKDASKDWGDANWDALLSALAPDLPGLGLVAVGAPADAERSGAVLARWPGATANLCGALSPRGSAAALGAARLLIGHDSGPLHLAVAGGTTTVGIFGDFNRPRRWHPYGPGHVAVHDMRGVGAITVERVADAVRAVLG